MFTDFDKYLAVFLTGFVVTYFLTPWVRQLAWNCGIIDVPTDRHMHKRPTPRGGGVAVAIGVHAACAMALLLPWAQYSRDFNVTWWKSFAFASFVLVVVGVIDDVRGLRPFTKLLGQLLAATIVFFAGSKVDVVMGWHVPVALSYAITVLWLLAVINAFNLIDGLDGLACGLAVTSALGLGAVLVILRVPGDSFLLLGLAGACLAFLRYNYHPASIFLGDTGSMFIGLTLGAVSLKSFTSRTFILSMAIPFFVLGVPLFDTLLAVWRRSVRAWLASQSTHGKAGGIMKADAEHLHHRLLKAGWTTRRVAQGLWVANAALVGCGILITSFQSYAVGILMVALVAGAHLILRRVVVIELLDTGRAVLRGFGRPSRMFVRMLVYPLWDILWLSIALAVAVLLMPKATAPLWETWLVSLPTWVAPSFAMLVAFRCYQVVWTRALAKDLMTLWVSLWLGLAWSMTTALLLTPDNMQRIWVWAFVVGGVSHLAIIGSRLFYRCAQEFVPWLVQKDPKTPAGERVVLYGAGGRCQLFLKERDYVGREELDGRQVVGLIDDDVGLRSRFVYGYRVLGNRLELPRLVRDLEIKGIVITAKLRADSRSAIQEAARELGLHLTEWNFEERSVSAENANGNGHANGNGADLAHDSSNGNGNGAGR